MTKNSQNLSKTKISISLKMYRIESVVCLKSCFYIIIYLYIRQQTELVLST